jgi:hypothetical protein
MDPGTLTIRTNFFFNFLPRTATTPIQILVDGAVHSHQTLCYRELSKLALQLTRNYQLMDDEFTGGMGFRQELPAH